MGEDYFIAEFDKMMKETEEVRTNLKIAYTIAKQLFQMGEHKALTVTTMIAGMVARMATAKDPSKFEEAATLMGILLKMSPPLGTLEKEFDKQNTVN